MVVPEIHVNAKCGMGKELRVAEFGVLRKKWGFGELGFWGVKK
jgi:hypothetical protein